jgi:nucleotide-binding universal stress UspA family protein
MKTILVLTNFSANATHAAEFSLMPAGLLYTNILLFNCYYNHATMPAYATGLLAFEEFSFLKHESEKKLENQIWSLRQKLSRQDIEITHQCNEGPIGKNVSLLLEQNEVEFIVIGSSAGGTVNHLFFGCDSMSIIDSANRPVLIVPPATKIGKPIEKVTLATAFGLRDIYAIEYLLQLSKVLGFKLEVVHVSLLGGSDEMPDEEEELKEKVTRSFINKIATPRITYKAIKGGNVIKRLNRLCEENGSDLLALVHHEHDFFTKIFKKCTTEEALANQPIPLMVFPANMKD